MHVCDRVLGMVGCGVQHIRDPSIRQELLVDGHLKVLDLAIIAEDLAQVALVDIFGELLDDYLGTAWSVGAAGS